MAEHQTPQQRAEAAAEALSAEGEPVTARAVRQRARVDMAVAASVARSWKDREGEMRAMPAMPDAVLARAEGVWREAVVAARDEHQAERDGWAAQLERVEAERDAFGQDVDRAEAERDEAREAARVEGETLRARIAELEERLDRVTTTAEQSVADAAARVQEAESRASAAEGVAEGLREGVSELRAALAALTPKKS